MKKITNRPWLRGIECGAFASFGHWMGGGTPENTVFLHYAGGLVALCVAFAMVHVVLDVLEDSR